MSGAPRQLRLSGRARATGARADQEGDQVESIHVAVLCDSLPFALLFDFQVVLERRQQDLVAVVGMAQSRVKVLIGHVTPLLKKGGRQFAKILGESL
jgi:hypothetical protein